MGGAGGARRGSLPAALTPRKVPWCNAKHSVIAPAGSKRPHPPRSASQFRDSSATQGGHPMAEQVTRRDLLKRLGVTIGAAAASAGSIVTPKAAEAQQKFTPKGNIPSTPFKTGHMTFFTGPAAVLGEQSYKGHILAAEEINAQGGLLGKRQIETIKADEAAGHRRQRQGAPSDEAVGEDRLLHRRDLERQHTGPRPGRRGGEVPDPLHRRLHGLPVREGRPGSALRLPPHQHPVGGRRDGRHRCRHRLARGRGRSPTSTPTTRTAGTRSITSTS